MRRVRLSVMVLCVGVLVAARDARPAGLGLTTLVIAFSFLELMMSYERAGGRSGGPARRRVGSAVSSRPVKTVAVMGAGPKGAAIAAQAYVLRKLGLADIRVVLIERDSPGAAWRGTSGYTDGNQLLGTPVFKDVAFPGRFPGADPRIARCLHRFSFLAFLHSRGELREWVDRGGYSTTHRTWARYMAWVVRHARPEVVTGKLVSFDMRRGRVFLRWETPAGRVGRMWADGLVLTGPGVPKRVPGGQDDDPDRVFDARTFWSHAAAFRATGPGRVAVIGRGESAGSVVAKLIDLNPELDIDVITGDGTLRERREQFRENQTYSSPSADWRHMDIEARRRFIQQTDRGVISPQLLEKIRACPRVEVRAGRVQRLVSKGGRVLVDCQGAEAPLEYDKVIVCIGFDPLQALRDLRPSRRFDPDWFESFSHAPEVDDHLRVRMPLEPGGKAVTVPVHLPMVAGESQGPGFPNLSCLGLLANRVLSAYMPAPPRAEGPINEVPQCDSPVTTHPEK